MDPDAALEDIRESIRLIHARLDHGDGLLPTAGQALELAEAVQALDEWLSKGGFLPEAWRQK